MIQTVINKNKQKTFPLKQNEPRVLNITQLAPPVKQVEKKLQMAT